MAELSREFLVKKFGAEARLKELTRIKLNNNKIRKINSNAFKGLEKLETISLNDNEIEEICSGLFDGLSNLKELNLNNNKLKRIDSNAFKELVKLEELSLHDNSIEEIDFRSFESLSNLKKLCLNKNKLKRIDSNIFIGLGNLERLSLHDNSIEEIEAKAFENLSDLREIDLNNNRLRRIESDTFKNLKKLVGLKLDHNEIEVLDVRIFDGLSNLRVLWLNNNKLKMIDSKTLKGLTKLERLILQENLIEEINRKAFENLSKLREIELSNNKLRKIDTVTFKNLNKLEELKLDHNEIEVLDVRIFDGLSNLRVLWLNNNKLKMIDSKTLKGPTKLERLILQENLIEEINRKAFENLSNLREIELNNNKLRKIDTVTFNNLNKLEELKLDHNEIGVLDERIFDGLSNLRVLWLNNNKLKWIDKNCFKSLKSIEILKLYDNAPSFVRNLEYDKDKLDQNEYISDWNAFLEHIHVIGYSEKFQSEKLLIVDYYDSLINEIDIYTEKILEKYTENDFLPDEPKVDLNNRFNHGRNFKDIESQKYHKFFEIDSIIDPYKEEYKFDKGQTNFIPGSTKLHDYVNQVRSKSIEEINKVREENLQQYEINRDKLKYDRNDLSPAKVEEMRRELFKEKFCFLLKMDDICGVKIPIKYITIITDFYLDFSSRIYLFGVFESNLKDKSTYFREKADFLQLLAKYISESLNMRIYGNEVISITENNLLNIERLKKTEIEFFNERGLLEMSNKNYNSLNFSNKVIDFSRLKSLEVRRRKLDYEKQLNNLSEFKNLEYFYVSYTIIGGKAFDCLNKLVKLDLCDCYIEKLPPNHFTFRLNVTNNSIKISDYNLFAPTLINLQILEITSLDFRINLESLENLKILILHYIKSFDLVENLGTRLTGLSISSGYNYFLKEVPNADKRDLFFKRHNFSKVTHLRLRDFGRHFNANWLLSFTNLKRLSLSNCGKLQIHKENFFDFLRSEIFSQLEFLDLSDNYITTIPTLSNLKSLKHLDISRNNIDLEPGKLFGIFRFFNCSRNNKDIFYGLINLESLDISRCGITKIDPEVFSNTPKLTHINLQYNSCTLDKNTFCYLKHLKKIELTRLRFELDSIDLDVLSRSNNIEIAISDVE